MTATLPTQTYSERALRLDFLLEQPNTLEIICQRVAEGESVKEIAKAWDVPHGKLSAWILSDEERTRQYFDAQRIHAHTLVSETVDIADNTEGDTRRDKLRIETRFQVAGYHDKARYGETAKGAGGTRVQVIVQRSQPSIEQHTEAVAIEATAQPEETT